MTVLFLLFQFEFLLFAFLLWLPWLALPQLYWIKVTREGILVLFLILEKMLLAFHCWYGVSYQFVICGLYFVELCFLYVHFLESFIVNGCWILSEDFSPSVDIIIWFLFFIFWCHTDWFAYIEKSLYPWGKFNLIMGYDPFNVLLSLVC